ncbi:MAG: hypothetical protein A2114_01255 [Candidatus Vogelbacteria bacterium GWA1_51_14]|uniref:Carboxypeptidase regulatory-like domain-containing protein n=1 Tax=Candidatus Vogelbacteria bacterium GWA1_51_14 TaxID=1802435 RepID=A0A1G2Q910_9BACT|nr:MAG: hypothetical protein A2114_01255 [Candidatus Vogelbacteria bacterium GWA1_51_14]
MKNALVGLIIIVLAGAWFWFNRPANQEEVVGEFWGTIQGSVSLGPICPVVSDPPDPACADKPYATRLALTTADQARVIKEFDSDAAGRFRVEAPPGEYAIRSAVAANILPYCQNVGPIKLAVNDYVEVAVTCDTGIR